MIATFFHTDEAGRHPWAQHHGSYAKPGTELLQKISAPIASSTTFLAGDDVVTKEDLDRDIDGLSRGNSRTRVSLKCGRCPTSVAARTETIFPIFDKLAEAGVREVSITAIAARLRRK